VRAGDAITRSIQPDKKNGLTPNGASTERIIEQVKRCPSGVLTYFVNKGKVE
jgi:uncharacterized Fe-S cluster protein YjdI